MYDLAKETVIKPKHLVVLGSVMASPLFIPVTAVAGVLGAGYLIAKVVKKLKYGKPTVYEPLSEPYNNDYGEVRRRKKLEVMALLMVLKHMYGHTVLIIWETRILLKLKMYG